MLVFAGMTFPILISGIWFLKYCILPQINPEHGVTSCAVHTEKHSDARTKKRSYTSETLGWTNVDYVCSNAKLYCFDAFFLKINEAVIKDDYIREKSDDETRVPNSQSCARPAV